jgi:hypothetical protein
LNKGKEVYHNFCDDDDNNEYCIEYEKNCSFPLTYEKECRKIFNKPASNNDYKQ